MLAASVKERLSLTVSPKEELCAFLLRLIIRVKSGVKRIIPAVDSAESANDAESALQGSTKRQNTIHNPNAFCDAGLRLAKKEKQLSTAMKAALNAEIGKAHTKSKKKMVRIDPAKSTFFGNLRRVRRRATKAIAKLKCAPLTATICASPAT